MTTIYMRERINDLTMAYKYKKKQLQSCLLIRCNFYLGLQIFHLLENLFRITELGTLYVSLGRNAYAA
jgi:hypothetical protein